MTANEERIMARKPMQGFTLVETLVSLVVLSVGMIGIAALYAQGLVGGRTAQYRTFAVGLASDMADRIRVNRLGLAAYGGAGANNNCDPGGVVCTPAQMAAHDLFVWAQQVQQILPNGVGQVQFNAGTLPPSYTIQVNWTEASNPDPGNPTGAMTHALVIRVPTL
jgi:type IV pilus assembly protein PilV